MRTMCLAAAKMLVALCGGALLGTGASAAAEEPATRPPLHQAALDGATPAELAQLIAAVEHVDVALEVNGRTPLHLAAYSGRPTVAKALLDAGASVAAVGGRGETPLHLAANEEVATLLINAGADVDAADSTGRTALHLAASRDAKALAALLIGAGASLNAVDGAGHTPLHEAAHDEALATAELLIAHGADVNVANPSGSTPLHMALLDDHTERPALAVATMLVENGADVNAQTALFGWAPLHLAAYHASLGDPQALTIVQALLKGGAEANVRTRLGGWTPVRMAHQGDANEAVLKLLTAAGGKDGGYDQAPLLPLPRALTWQEKLEREEEARREPTARVRGRFKFELDMPSTYSYHQDAVQGSFTMPGATERLLFEHAGLWDGDGPYTVAALEDWHGNVLPLMAYNHYTTFVGICRDPATDTDTVMFQQAYEGSCCAYEDRVYFHYDAEAGELMEVLKDAYLDDSTAAPDEQGTCDWRRKKKALATYREAVGLLAVGELPKLTKDGSTQTLPTRAVPSPVVDEQLATLRQLPEDVVEVWEVDGSPRWRIVGVEHDQQRGNIFSDPCGGVVLVRDVEREQWHSIYDCADLEATEVHDDVLTTALNDKECWPRSRFCHLEVDLATSEAQLWDEPAGNHWINWRERPGDND